MTPVKHSRKLVLKRSKERSLEQHLRLRAPQTCQCCVQAWISTCERQWSRVLLRTCLRRLVLLCQRVSVVENRGMKSRSVVGATRSVTIVARLDISRRSADNVKGQVPRGKSSGKGDKSRSNTSKCYCCGQSGHKRPDCPRRNEVCSRVNQILVRTSMLELSSWNLTSPSDDSGNLLSMIMDSGAEEHVVSLADWKRLGEPLLRHTQVRLRSATGDGMRVYAVGVKIKWWN